MSTEQLTAIVLAAIAAPGFWEVLKNLIDKIMNRTRVTNEDIAKQISGIKKSQDSQQKDIDGLKESINEMKKAETLKDALSARRRILKFNDELLRNVNHSKETFDDLLSDIDLYERYCDLHKDSFPNGKTVMATKNIKKCYENCMEKHSFLS